MQFGEGEARGGEPRRREPLLAGGEQPVGSVVSSSPVFPGSGLSAFAPGSGPHKPLPRSLSAWVDGLAGAGKDERAGSLLTLALATMVKLLALRTFGGISGNVTDL